MRVAVAGGTGVTGRHVVEALEARGHEPVVVARSRGVDLMTGRGLDSALESADAVIDVSNVVTTGRRKAEAFFGTAGRNLLAAGARAGVRHHVALSIVGIDRVGLGYYQGKRLQEKLVRTGPLPWSVLRATQFHEFPQQLLDRMAGPVVLVPPMATQPVAVREVAGALVDLVEGPPQGMAPEFAGPRVEDMAALTRRLLKSRGSRRLVLSPRLPGAVFSAMADGGLLPAGQGARGVQTWDEWLDGVRPS
ncbi:NAD(P)H-binding protein [Streptomyces sp. PLK6-54]|uniref:NAD(P)H-binding protein n=2 Tax=Actinacidiphila acidipaludis TaxID=2873382 RepID=A0ABS7QDX2_9ACTN|nr:NAD(P)H-binding protein [Streptomyces acidipaludis]